MEVVSEDEIKETALAFIKRGTATDSSAASSHDATQVAHEKSTSSRQRSTSKRRDTGTWAKDKANPENTTVVMNNLPVDYSHEKARGLIDSLGFRDRYDAVIWFPRKQSGTQHLSHAFVNFRTPSDCLSFRKRLKQRNINPSGETQLRMRDSGLSVQGPLIIGLKCRNMDVLMLE